MLECRCARESPAAAVTSSTPSSSRSKHLQRKIEVIELLESADESNNPRAVVGTEQQLRLRQKNPVGVFANLLGTGTDDSNEEKGRAIGSIWAVGDQTFSSIRIPIAPTDQGERFDESFHGQFEQK